MTHSDRVRQRREMHKRIRAVVAERRMADRSAPFSLDDDDEVTVELRVEPKTV